MTTGIFIVLIVSTFAGFAYAQCRFPRQQLARFSTNEKLKNVSLQQTFSTETNPEQATHNLEYSDQLPCSTEDCPPIRNVLEADFAAEAHGFTGFEAVGKGSRYKSSHGS